MSKQVGFSLIELMIVLAIISIIASFAVPTYFEQIRKAKRSDGMAKIMEIQLKQETWRSDHRTYTADLTAAGLGVDTASITDYTFTITLTPGSENTSYLVTATALGPQAQDGGSVGNNVNGACAVLTINQSNVRGPSACWF